MGHDLLTPVASAVYRSCAVDGPASTDELAGRLDLAPGEAERALAELELLGLAARADGVAQALAPVALDGVVAEHARRLEASQQAAARLAEVWLRRARRSDHVDVLESPLEAQAAEDQFMREARAEVRALSIGPVHGHDPVVTPEPPRDVVDGEFAALRRGVRVRAVYDRALLQDPRGLRLARECIDAGEEARACAGVPLNLVLYDDDRGVFAVPGVGGQRRHLVVVRHPGALAVATDLFEAFWRMGVPLPRDGDGPTEELDADSRKLLAYLAAGVTDDVIARELGVSGRTVGRRIARLQEQLGAATRFQLALQAQRRGWLSG